MCRAIYAWFRGMSLSWRNCVTISDVLNDLYSLACEYDVKSFKMVFKKPEELVDTDLDVGDDVMLVITDWSPFGAKIVATYFDGYKVTAISDNVYHIERRKMDRYKGVYIVYQKTKIFYSTLDPLYILNEIKTRFGDKTVLTIKIASKMETLYKSRGYKNILIVTPIRFFINEDMVRQVFGEEYNIVKLSKNRGYYLAKKTVTPYITD
ncbi:MAG: hypothetical protein JHC26_02145 [Thermofilum sp.]|uniref:hypothetical protein n=1 Tax=Thermofilum sp. TaxID=1961369 RepID=UPI002585209E|nr:hypothetical protein [Thermofilum sp.]MCI4407865.1 hypothetical protein [Thermofilum sp.]